VTANPFLFNLIAVLIAATYHNYIGYTEIQKFLSDNKDILHVHFEQNVPSLSTIHKLYKNINNDCFEQGINKWVDLNMESNLTKVLIGEPLFSILDKCKPNILTNNYKIPEIQKIIKKSNLIALLQKTL